MYLQIYKITNLITGLSYIGKDQNDKDNYMGSGILLWNSYRKRFNRDDLDSSKKTHHQWVYEQNKIYKYYEKTILHKCKDSKELCELEKYYIEKFNTIRPNGYNIANGGEGGYLVAGYSDEEKENWKKKISKSTKEAMNRPEVKENLLKSVTNKSDEWKNIFQNHYLGEKVILCLKKTKKN